MLYFFIPENQMGLLLKEKKLLFVVKTQAKFDESPFHLFYPFLLLSRNPQIVNNEAHMFDKGLPIGHCPK